MQGDKKYGLMCMVASVLITGMGVTLFFNKFLIRLGNVSVTTAAVASLTTTAMITVVFRYCCHEK
jgi:hypothetical protein